MQRLGLPKRREANVDVQVIVQFFARKRKILLLTVLVYAAMM
jgi:hypothetical protein